MKHAVATSSLDEIESSTAAIHAAATTPPSEPGNAPPSTEQLTAKDIETARQRHLLRFLEQVEFWSVMGAVAVLTYPVQYATIGGDVEAHVLSQLVLPIFLLGVYAWHLVLIKEDWHREWTTAVNQAQATLSPVSTAQGYTQIFGVYVETKRRSSQLITMGVALFFYAMVGAWLNLGLSGQVASILWWDKVSLSPIILGLLAFQLTVSYLLLRHAYAMGSSYLAGDVIVRHTLALALHATAQVSNLQEAKKQIEDDTQTFIRKSPWWFYPG